MKWVHEYITTDSKKQSLLWALAIAHVGILGIQNLLQ